MDKETLDLLLNSLKGALNEEFLSFIVSHINLIRGHQVRGFKASFWVLWLCKSKAKSTVRWWTTGKQADQDDEHTPIDLFRQQQTDEQTVKSKLTYTFIPT